MISRSGFGFFFGPRHEGRRVAILGTGRRPVAGDGRIESHDRIQGAIFVGELDPLVELLLREDFLPLPDRPATEGEGERVPPFVLG